MDANQLIEILGKISNGQLLTDIVQDVGPFFDFIEKSEELTAAYENAQKRRARVFLEKAIQQARGSDKQTAVADKLLVDTYKWASLVADPQKFSGKAVEASGDLGPYNLVTGVPDAADNIDGVPAPDPTNRSTPKDSEIFGSSLSQAVREDGVRDQSHDRQGAEE